MKRDECWMTFSEALERYLDARDAAKHFGYGVNRTPALEEMKEAAEHMDALTALPEQEPTEE